MNIVIDAIRSEKTHAVTLLSCRHSNAPGTNMKAKLAMLKTRLSKTSFPLQKKVTNPAIIQPIDGMRNHPPDLEVAIVAKLSENTTVRKIFVIAAS